MSHAAAPRRDSKLSWLATLAGLWSVAIVQPYLDLVGRQPEFLLAHQVEGGRMVALAAGLVLVPPLLLWAIAQLAAALSRRLGIAVRGLFSGVLLAVLALVLLDRAPLPGRVAVATAVVLAALTLLATRRWPRLAELGPPLALGVVAVPIFFLFGSPARRLLVAGGQVAGATRIGNPVPVVLVLFDELPLVSLLGPDGEIDAGRYPNFARLAATARWYRHATAVAPVTTAAVPAILSGLYPTAHALPTSRDHPRNLFALLGGHYDLRVEESRLTRMCPRPLCAGAADEAAGSPWRELARDSWLVWLHLVLPRDLRAGLPSIDNTWGGFTTDTSERDDRPGCDPATTRGRLARLLAGFEAPRAGPSLHYVHFDLPHLPWRYLPSGRDYDLGPNGVRPEGLLGGASAWVDEEWPVVVGWQRHLLQVGYADLVLGRILDGAVRSGLFDRALLVVTADHGCAFVPGEPNREVSPRNWEQVLSVPLFVKLPGEHTATVDDRNVEEVDILPTVVDFLGAESDWRFDGQSLLRAAAGRVDKRLVNAHRGGVEMRFPAVPDLAPALGAKLRHFGWSGDDRLYAAGPHSELLGRTVASLLGPPPPRGARVQLDATHRLAHVQRRGRLPLLISGSLAGAGTAAPVPLAIAIDGVVRATSWTHHDRFAQPRFVAMLPETALPPGRHEPAVFVIDEALGDARLAPLSAETVVPWTMRAGALYDTTGRQIPISPQAIAGVVGEAGGALVGRAAARTGGATRCQVLVFADGQLVASAAAEPDSTAGTARFQVPLPLVVAQKAYLIRVFGVADGQASELDYQPGWRWGRAAARARRAADRTAAGVSLPTTAPGPR